ncbi:MAG: hypothetical protein JNK82_40210 [Myxococcaceae bacterium]|nr:hypothetical protein [Myxococcaceae bacterium]
MTEAPPNPGLAPSKAIAIGISRCAESLLDVDRLRGETNALKSQTGELATFAAALFELECAKKGDPDARANMLVTADQLLQFWRDRSGDQLAAAHPTLSQLWTDASALLISFEGKRIDRALKACFEARQDAALLQAAMLHLTPAGDRRVEFATCLYHLELARLFVDTSRAEFARRIALVHEAYNDRDVAAELVGKDEGLAALWKDLIPYLDEFFEAQEQEEEVRKKAETDPNARAVLPPTDPGAPAAAAAPPPPPPMSDPNVAVVPPPAASPPQGFVSEAALLTSAEPADEVEIIEGREMTPAPAPLPPGVDPTPPPPPRTASQDGEVEIVELEEAPVAPPPPPRTKTKDLDVLVDYEPSDEAQTFWRHTEAALGLLPDSNLPRSGARVLSADGRSERKKLNVWLDGMNGRFTDVPEAKAMQCLMRLYMAAQIKQKTLFGQPNPKRKEAFKVALALLSADAGAAGRAAVWFELDGPETIEHLQTGLEVVQDFLQYCAREGKDPLDGAVADEFLQL